MKNEITTNVKHPKTTSHHDTNQLIKYDLEIVISKYIAHLMRHKLTSYRKIKNIFCDTIA